MSNDFVLIAEMLQKIEDAHLTLERLIHLGDSRIKIAYLA